MFGIVHKIKVVKRGLPGTPQAGTWVFLEPGWTVVDSADGSEVMLKRDPVIVEAFDVIEHVGRCDGRETAFLLCLKVLTRP